MANINIHTTLCSRPAPKKHEILVITRGSTASLTYDLLTKVFTIDDIDQLTISFKQGKKISWFNMVDYFTLSDDTEVVEGKQYYSRIPANVLGSSMYKFKKIAFPEGNPHENEYFELCNLAHHETTENWQFDDHFYYFGNEVCKYISFTLSPEETTQFKLTEPDCLMQYEIAVRLNTDELEGMHHKDSIIIEPQHPVAVVDSLYGNILPEMSPIPDPSVYASENTYCSESLVVKK